MDAPISSIELIESSQAAGGPFRVAWRDCTPDQRLSNAVSVSMCVSRDGADGSETSIPTSVAKHASCRQASTRIRVVSQVEFLPQGSLVVVGGLGSQVVRDRLIGAKVREPQVKPSLAAEKRDGLHRPLPQK